MIIIGHRGAAGLAPENTLLAIKTGIAAGADAIEFDVRITKDKALVLCHDPDLKRTAGNNKLVSSLVLGQIKSTGTYSGENIPTLKEVFEISGKTPLVIEGKGNGWAEPLVSSLTNYNGPRPTVISKNHGELAVFKNLAPAYKTYAVTIINPFKPISAAKQHGFTGITVNKRLLNPLTYMLARQANLNIGVYVVNSKLTMRLLKLFYPRIDAITTDFPDRFKGKEV